MTVPKDEHERSLAIAEIAIGQIRALCQLASPRNFEIWYNYASGSNPSLNEKINRSLEEKGTLSEADLEEIYRTFIAHEPASDQIDTVGARVLDEIKQVLDMVDTAAGSASAYSENLSAVSKTLERVNDGASLCVIVDRLLQGAKEMATSNRRLEERLSASRQEIRQLQQNLEAVRNESFTDPLTTLSNRKFFDQAFSKFITEAKEKHEPLSLLLADIDHFKSFNDKYGHLTGDQVLRLVAISLKQNVKGQDIAARYGGEEFAIALPNTALLSATTVADHLRRAVMTKELMKRTTGERLGRVTVSIGVAAMRANDTPQSLIERADTCLYAAKGNGRNRVICETDPEAEAAANPGATARVA
jgi:diguanylate cyclase